MVQQPPAVPQKPAPAASVKQEPVLPDERFWVRYSPHHELPLSSVSSFSIHVLIIGLLLLFAALPFFQRVVHEVPVKAVRFGGGGQPHVSKEGPGPGTRPPEEVGEPDTQPDPNPPAEASRLPDLERLQSPEFLAPFNKDARRFFNQPNPPPNLGKFAALDEAIRKKIRPGPATGASSGHGGDGSGGGRGNGQGPGEGDDSGPGKGSGTLTQREKRMLRWTMVFDTNNGPDYLAQLRGLGAILAIPVNEEKAEFKLVKQLTPPAQLEDEDVAKIKRIYWVDNKPESVRDLMAALGVKVRPRYFVAFMPLELEKKLFEMEKAAAEGRAEDDIRETKFKVVRKGDQYVPVFASISFKGPKQPTK
jgi:hypothetical protein